MAEDSLILVVDDNKMNRDLLSRFLVRQGYQVATAEGGREALELIERENVGLVMLDLMMPEMSGVEVTRELRKTRSMLELPIIIVSANSDSREQMEAIGAGANDYITKPIEFGVTQMKVKNYMTLRSQSVATSKPTVSTATAASTSAPISTHALKPGDVVGHYELGSLLGEGGMGKVFRATDTKLLRPVAFKVILGEKVDEIQATRFLQEARAVARISHPGVVSIYDIGEEPARYIAMELVEGEPLEDILENTKPLPPARAKDLALQLLEALDAVHSKGILHRDLKPANIMVDEADRIKVMDFGLAKIVDDNLKLTKTGEVWGTPQYMSPEHVDPSFGEVDHQSDLFAAATILYEMLTGRLPVKSTKLHQILFELVSKKPDPARQVNPQVSAALSDVCARGLDKNKKTRYQSAREFAESLRAANV